MTTTPLVLLVDDVDDTRGAYAELIRMAGFRVEQAKDGIEAVQKAAAIRPDVILMDLGMPRLNGWEAARQIRSGDTTRAIPIIALTAHAVPQYLEVARAAGCDSVLLKPCALDHILGEIRRLLASRTESAAHR